MVKIIASMVYNLHQDYETVMNTPFRPMTMILMVINEMMSETPQSNPVDLSSNPTWAQNIIDQVQNEHDL